MSSVQFIQLDHINFTTQVVVTNQFSINDVSQNEGNSGTSNYTFTITRSNNTVASSVQVQSSNGTASSGTDYTAFLLTMVDFTAGGALTQTVNVTVNGDVTVEPNETFTMTLSNPTAGVLLDATGTGTVVDDDAINEPFEDEVHNTTTFSQSGNNFQTTGKLIVKNSGNFGAGGTSGYAASTAPYAVGNQGSLQITSPGKSFNIISADLWAAAVSGSAPNFVFTANNCTITFTGTKADGSGTVTHTAAITPTNPNGHSTINFAASPFAGVQLSAISFSTLSGIQYLQIDNFKYGTATLTNTQLSIDNVNVIEGTGAGSTTATLTVTCTNNTTGFTVNVASSDGTATAGTDYTAFPSTTLTFTSGGASTQIVTVTILKDAIIEPNENFNMTLSGATNGTVYLKQTGIGTIQNDDSVIETFEDETNLATTFSESGVSFSATAGYRVRQANLFGSGSSNFYLTSTNNAVGNQGTFSLNAANKAFKINGLDAWVVITETSHSSGLVTFTGTLFGGGTVTTTKTITATSSTGTGYQLNVTFTGTPLENVLLTAIQVTTAGALTEFDIDNFNFTVVNTLPIIEVVDASNVAITNGGVAATGNNTDFGVACINAGTVYARCTVSGCASVASPIVSVNVITPLSASPGNVNITWTGAINTDWNTACNWSPAWVSDASNNQVIIPSVANQPIIDATTTAIIKVIYINGTLTINNGGILNVRGNGGIDAEISVYGTLSNSGSVRLETAEAGTLSGHGISIWNNATVTKYHCLWWIFGTEDDLINRNFRINISILNGEIGDLYTTLDNIRHIVTFNGSSTSTVLDGFTITGGNANFDSKNIVFYLLAPITEPLSRVGGITVENAGNPVIINCIFVSNSAVTGGGLFAGDNSKPTITGCKFMGNLASFGAGMYFQDGSHAKVVSKTKAGQIGIRLALGIYVAFLSCIGKLQLTDFTHIKFRRFLLT